MARTKVIDEYALLTFLENGPGAQRIHDLIIKAEEKKARILISSFNLSLAWFVIAKAKSPERADRTIKNIRSLPIELVEVDWSISHLAGQISLKSGLPLPDCLGPALAKSSRADLVTGNTKLESLSSFIKIEMVPG